MFRAEKTCLSLQATIARLLGCPGLRGYGPDPASHRQHLREVLCHLCENSDHQLKSVFGQEEVKFLGHQVSASGIRPLLGQV